jgi:nitric oxide reductase subunit B
MTSLLAFWISNIGMLGMTGAFAVAGIAQVYLERKFGMDFMVVQREIEVHFHRTLICGYTFYNWDYTLYL